ncbi:putative gns1 sur4 family protein [Diplogelasinospora grovesii]|uniref:Elongation of fatty acids protein n=1 Tax=Diplogelasinospora grovesii TaxID=303347 RepID=A0AAN6N657_9PEZI|nr:putative gns1 sur4 family protein [Diplogelasinospora grovesii]
MSPELPLVVSLPSPSLFSFPPGSEPGFMTPPPPASIPSAPPFSIPEHIYQAVLDPKVPITIAAVYAVTAKLLNAYNTSTGKKPWALSKTRAFWWFVVAHNVFLAVYSAWTWWGMFGALRRSMVNPLGPEGFSGFVDSVCRLNGPGGLGNAAFFDEQSQSWQSHSSPTSLAPSRFDQGRLWNEGLAFYGWIFYLSKFYEVLDTFIILAKGKLSSTLQTYHHAGAMMCMWAGMRYMSSPIWMFVFVNSGIHAMMYTYYTVTAFNIRVPVFIKRTLTSLQITQFLVGASYAMSHSFVSYTVPVTAGAKAASAAAAAAATAAPAAATIADNIKTFVSEAATRAMSAAEGAPSAAAALDQATTSYTTVPCITTSGATFAVWLNVLYLAPLTYLFMSFFVESYLRRSNAESKKKGKSGKATKGRRLSNVNVDVTLAEKAGWEAAKNVEREVYGEGKQ